METIPKPQIPCDECTDALLEALETVKFPFSARVKFCPHSMVLTTVLFDNEGMVRWQTNSPVSEGEATGLLLRVQMAKPETGDVPPRVN